MLIFDLLHLHLEKQLLFIVHFCYISRVIVYFNYMEVKRKIKRSSKKPIERKREKNKTVQSFNSKRLVLITIFFIYWIVDVQRLFLEDREELIENTIKDVLHKKNFDGILSKGWSSEIVERLLHELALLHKNYKYIVRCLLMEKNGSGIHEAVSCHWEVDGDSCYTFRWENKTMHCIVTIYCLEI